MIHILKPLFVLYRLEPFNIIGILAIKQIFQNDICIKKNSHNPYFSFRYSLRISS